MIKYLKYTSIVCSIILSVTLVININKYLETKNNNQSIIESTNEYELKIIDNNTKKEELENKIKTLKETKKDKVLELEQWINWNKEIKEKIN